MDNAIATAQQFNAADILWVIGAVILIALALKVVGKLVKLVLWVGAIVLILGFLFNLLG